MSASNKAAQVAPPIAATTFNGPGEASTTTSTRDGVFRLATAATAQNVNIPAKWKGRWWTIRAIGLDIQIVFGGESVAAVLNQVSSVSSEDATLHDGSGVTIPAGGTVDWLIPDHVALKEFSFISTGTSGYIEIYPSDCVHPGKN